jgi:hypothetical protein
METLAIFAVVAAIVFQAKTGFSLAPAYARIKK